MARHSKRWLITGVLLVALGGLIVFLRPHWVVSWLAKRSPSSTRSTEPSSTHRVLAVLTTTRSWSVRTLDRIRQDLLDYCERDTWATVKLLERLSELAAL